MKRIIIYLITMCTIICMIGVSACKTNKETEYKYYEVVYMSEEGGIVEGEHKQKIKEGESTSPVIAVPYTGYEFDKWSDGKKTVERKDENVKASIYVTAKFKKIPKATSTFTLDFRTADGYLTQQTTTLTINNKEIVGTKIPVPEREHFTFNGWYILGQDKKQCVTDKNGIINGNANLDTTTLIPSWTANETFKFKLLLVYVTEIHAELPTRFIAENRTKQVDYVMTEEEIEIQHITTRKVREYLNDMLDGLVEFEVDEYFTTQPITTENFTHPDDGTERDSALFPESIPEVENIIGIYDSVLSSFSINDFNNELNNSSGMAKAQSGEIHFDHALLYPASLNKVSLKKLIENEEHRIWDSYINTYIHELAHTIEMRVNSYSYHLWIGDAGWKQHLDDKYIQKLYYTGNALMEGKKVGLPYSFWAGQIPIVKYEWTKGGYVTCEKQEVLYGGDTYEVEAVERDGYRFVGWSDGLTEPQRIERNVTSDITIKAIFEKIT